MVAGGAHRPLATDPPSPTAETSARALGAHAPGRATANTAKRPINRFDIVAHRLGRNWPK
jgi:hypothetical protein